MGKPEILITGANGEVGNSLIRELALEEKYDIVALDLREPEPGLERLCKVFYLADILDEGFLREIAGRHRFEQVFHLAGLLSSSAEKNPNMGHRINVEGSRNILDIARIHSDLLKKPVVFIFSSSIAAYGILPGDDQSRPVTERQYLTPITMYGMNKLYVEQLGRYYSEFFKLGFSSQERIDFRCVRFPGLISPDTEPSGGTSDYGPKMLHAAACGVAYECFVRPDTTMPFMVMSDAIRALIMLSKAPREGLKSRIYNLSSFSVSAEDILNEINLHFPGTEVTFVSNPMRQAIVDSWPNDMDDRLARAEWGWAPQYGFKEAFEDLLVPKVKARYGKV